MSQAVIGRIPLDDDRNPVLGGLSNADGQTAIPAYIDSATNAVLVKVASGGSGGTQYQELATTSPATGTVALGRYSSTPPTLTNGQLDGLQLDSSGNLKVNAAAMSGTTDSVAINDGTNTANVLAPGTAQSTANALLVAATSQSATFSVTSVSSGTTYDVGNYASVRVQINSQYTGSTPTISYQVSNDGTNWFSAVLFNSSSASGAAPGAASTTGTGVYAGSLQARYFRLTFTGAYSSGTAAGLIVFSTAPFTPAVLGISVGNSVGYATIGSAIPASGVLASAKGASSLLQPLQTANSAGATGSSIEAQLAVGNYLYNGTNADYAKSGGVTGMAGVSLQASPSGGYLFNHQSANGTTTIKSGTGTLHTVTVNNAGTTDTITLYDNTAGSGTVIAVIGSTSEATFTYDLAFSTGLTAVIAGTTAPDVTFTYK